MHLTIYTRPDIIHAITKLSQFNSNPGRIHWKQAKHLLPKLPLCYLSGTKEYALQYTTGAMPEIQIFSNVDWAGDVDRHSYSGMVITTGQRVIH